MSLVSAASAGSSSVVPSFSMPPFAAAEDAASMDKNWDLTAHFGHIKMISSNPDSARCRQSKIELAAIGLTPNDYELAPGVDGSKLDKALWERMVKWGCDKLSSDERDKRLQGQTGCYMAHYNALKDTVERYRDAVKKLEAVRANSDAPAKDLQAAVNTLHKYRSVLIFEDNVGFGKVTGPQSADRTGYGLLFQKAMKELKGDWDMVYFMSMYGAKKVSDHLAQLEYGLVAKCYAISAKMYDKALKALEIIVTTSEEIKPVDHVFARLHRETNAFVTLPPLCYRAASQSEVGGDLGKKKKEEPKHWQNNVDIKKSPEEEALERPKIEAFCTAEDKLCALSNLEAKAVELRANNFLQAKALIDPVNAFTKKNLELKANHEKSRTSRHTPESDFDATDIQGRQNFIFAGCPKNSAGAGGLISTLLNKKGCVAVSTLESHEGKDKYNNFWTKEKVSRMPMYDGWRLEHMGEKEIGHGADDSKLIETTIKATNSAGVQTLTHLHYYGWVDRHAAPDDQLLFATVMRMRELSPNPAIPFSINCHGGVGRTGTTGLCTELFHEIDAQRSTGTALDNIRVNILGTLFKFRMQGREIVHQETAFAQIFAVVGLYYKYLKIQENLKDITPKEATSLIANYAV